MVEKNTEEKGEYDKIRKANRPDMGFNSDEKDITDFHQLKTLYYELEHLLDQNPLEKKSKDFQNILDRVETDVERMKEKIEGMERSIKWLRISCSGDIGNVKADYNRSLSLIEKDNPSEKIPLPKDIFSKKALAGECFVNIFDSYNRLVDVLFFHTQENIDDLEYYAEELNKKAKRKV